MAEEIKKIDNHAPIIIISAFDDKETLLKAINIGIDYFTPKPLNINILHEKLNQISQNLYNQMVVENNKKREMEDLYHLAHYDTLTKVPNRFLFDIKLEQAISRAKRNHSIVTLFFIDLDDFKIINDTFGHPAGDKVLQTISKNIKNIVRIEDIFARIGGDEFALIVEGIKDINYIENIAKKIMQTSTSPIIYEDKEINLTFSIGISQYPKDTSSKTELIRFADIAMYKAKKVGKSNYAFFN